MIEFFAAGGWMMFVVLAAAVPLLIAAAKFARSASPHGLSIIRALTTAVAFAAVGGVVTDLAAVCRHVVSRPELANDLVASLLGGINESLAPAILACPLIAIAWILVAFGMRRMPHD